jgi:biotin carboxylase
MKRLAIIGASYLQLPLVKKAKEMGIETHCFAWEEGAVCKGISDYFYPISILEQNEIFKICKTIGIDGITTIATDMAVPTISYIAERLGLISNSYSTALIATNKALMRDAFKIQNCNSPKFIVTNISSEFINCFDFPVVVKPVDRSGSRGVTKVENKFGISEAIQNAINESFSKEAIIEEFIEGNEVSVESISWQGKHFIITITDKITTGSPHFVELAHHQPSNLSFEIQEKIKQETVKVLDAINLQNGASHAEFRITNKGEVYVIEVGARMGGDFIGSHLVQLSTGYDFVKGVIDVALNQFDEPNIDVINHSGVYFLCEETKLLLPYFKNKTNFEVEKKIQDNKLKNITNSNDRSGYLIYQASRKIELL